MASPVVAWSLALLVAGLSTASPTVSFPINSQVPPVARLGQPFSFVFSPSTFSSSSPITYSLSNPPKWLSIDSDARRLFGTPESDDIAPGHVEGVPLNLVASDDSGSTTLTATLVVSRSPGPKLKIPLEKQVPNFGTFSSPSAFLSAPGTSFSFRLDTNTFSNPPSAPINYYATTADNTPLPAWISFDPTSLSFSGRTPSAESLIQPPQHFPFQVIASDVVGFAGAAMGFDIVVGSHQLAADETTIVLDATPGTLLSYTGLNDTVKVDGKPAAPGTVVIASTSKNPPWLTIDKHTFYMTGFPPETAESTNFTVTIRDTFSNSLNLTILVEVVGDKAGLFTGEPPKLTISPGKPFSIDLGPYLSNPQDIEISVETDSSHAWIRFNSSTATLFGDAPEGLMDSAANVKINAKSRHSRKSASMFFDIVIRAGSGGKGSTATDPTTAGAHPTESPGDQHSLSGDGLGNSRFNPVLLAVLLPLLLLLALAVCALFWYFRRRKDRQRPALSTRDISGPLPGTFVTTTHGLSVSHSLPDFTKRFGKSFSADDVFGPDKKTYLESRTAFLTRPDLPRPVGPVVRLLPPSGSPSSDTGAPGEDNNTPVVASGALVTLRPGTRGKISSSLSSITETSTIGELVDSRGLESVGTESRSSFRDKIEINVPRLLHTPGLTYADSPSPTEAMPTPRPGSSRTSPETGLSYCPPASAVRKLSWLRLKGVKGKRQGSKLVPGMKRLSEQPSVLTVDTFTPEMAGMAPPTIAVTQGDSENEAAVLESASLPLPQFPSRTSLSRPPTRSRPATCGNMGNPRQEPPLKASNDTTTTPAAPARSLLSNQQNAIPDFPTRVGETPADSLDIYDDIIEHNPFRPSRTWSTVPTTDEWVDETVESLALSRSASQQKHQNWTVLQESLPVIKSRDATAPGRLSDVASSVGLPQVREGEGEVFVAPCPVPLRAETAAAATLEGRGDGMPERSGLTRKSQSKGVSLRSEGSKSDYAIFI
ncbi:hypothetical protein C8A00DRAFT_17171 [Chaetomidium leptoderma]|uniref:Dystroglycan-type cadherin-like domain-containing protein n=1 Tax=Chaetomidium leptoderma TaxID=669021 RepID=A0AAN6VH08_9PEZI|nr:hypothetical protein C8A00DRAFT_17171 [Chaetomidium leptoderma]